ncbi:MAG: glutaredoxin family protein [Burkholderiaceae bacterium]
MNQMPVLNRFKTLQTAIKLIAVLAIITPASNQLYAQQVYKSVDKNGRVTYSEVPPLPGSGDKLTADPAASVSLPYALQQVVSRYPVTLYTTADCGPCINARLMLTQRGVPFAERTISSNEDIAAYKKLNIDNNFPLATIAAQQLKGYEETEWTKYLDAAGYPKSSTLPRNYKNAEATSLTPKKVVEKAEKEVTEKPASTRAARPAAAPQEPNNNPAGIKF